MPRVISAQQVRQLLPMTACIDVLRAAMHATSTGTVSIPPRQFSNVANGTGLLGLMPGSSSELATYGVKVISLHADNPRAGRPAIQGFIALFDERSGAPIALLEAAAVTGIRTAAASGLATQLLAREAARSCGIFGAGVQAQTHIDAMCAVRPVEEFLIWARNFDAAVSFAEQQCARTGVPVRAVADPAEAGACDLICTVTGASEPVLQGAWVQPGAHVNLVGAHNLATREADTTLIAKSRLYVDMMESCRNEGGDFMIPVQEGAIAESAILGEVGQLISGELSGREMDGDITVYNSLGTAAQDLFAARFIYDRAMEASVGSDCEL